MTNLRLAALALTALFMSALLTACTSPGSNGLQPGGTEGTFALHVVVQGPGTVVIDDLEFVCTDDCTARIGAGVTVELRAQADSGNGFAGWQQACSGSATCTVTMNSDMAVTAVFAENVLSLVRSGDGGGVIRIVPPDVTCEDDCSLGYETPLNVSLTVSLADGTSVQGWGGACSDSGTSRQCVVRVEGQTNITLTLADPPEANPDSYSTLEGQTLNVSAGDGVLANDGAGDGDGAGDSLTAVLESGPSKGELALNSDGSFRYEPDTGATGQDSFRYRARDSSGNSSDDVEVTIDITPLPRHTLTVEVNGSGDVTSSPGGIDCGSDCSVEFRAGQTVTLTANPTANADFVGWGGGCSGTNPTCTVEMDSNKEVTASFELAGFPLAATVVGDGSGTVTSSPAGIDCGSDCDATFDPGTPVSLTATPTGGSTFVGWSGCDSVSGSTCNLTMNAAKNVAARFDAPEPAEEPSLTVALTGDGTGSVTGSGIDCEPDCNASFASGTPVTLFATVGMDSTFGGWGGDCAGEESTTCELTMDTDRNVSAAFVADSPASSEFTLNVDLEGDGSVFGDGFDCPPDCDETYSAETTVTLTSEPAEGSVAEGWSGGCDDSTDTECRVTVDDDRTVTAKFAVAEPEPEQHQLDVSVEGDGTVASDPSGVDCPGDCGEDFDEGTEVTLTATPADSGFESWAGCDSSDDESCTLTMDGPRRVTASFSPLAATFSLDLQFKGDGSGSVAISPPDGDSCSETCSKSYDEDETVALTARPDDDSTFEWDGACDGTAEKCNLTMDADKNVTITFNARGDDGSDDDDDGESSG